jgi:endo-1,4-beta-mannosidase
MRKSPLITAVAFIFLTMTPRIAEAQPLQSVRVSDDRGGFVRVPSGDPFTPWGFNYDHDSDGRLIEAYWHDRWDKVEADFQEMKRLGANVVRVHLQVGEFMLGPAEPNRGSLHQLARLVTLAEQTGLYLDITGLGCYHKQDVPPWYDGLDESARWAAQAAFWEAVAKTCAASPAIFCYDLMNEPVVPGGDSRRDDWLGPAFGGKHFTQFVSLDRRGRPRPDIARDWIRTLVAAIRKHDSDHLITVGLVDWSLDRPGLTSGFVPEKIADDLDFIAVHIYPHQGKIDEALDTLKGFAATGKPVVIEEIFPLKCDIADLERFIEASRNLDGGGASGWIGFYWGKTAEEYRQGPQSIAAAITRDWLQWFERKSPEMLATPTPSIESP